MKGFTSCSNSMTRSTCSRPVALTRINKPPRRKTSRAQAISSPAHPALGPPVPKAAVAFPALLCIGTATACTKPALLSSFQVDATLTLGFALFCIASTTTFDAIKDVLSPPGWPVLCIGFVIGCTIFPLLCCLAAVGGQWALPTTLGLAVLGACPPGTASNMVGSRLARAHTPLNTALAIISTLAAALLFPITYNLITNLAPAAAALNPTWDASTLANIFFQHTLQGVVLPVLAGLTAAALFPSIASRTRPFAPLLGASMILLTVTNKTAHAAPLLSLTSPSLILTVFAIHAAAFALGYVAAKLAGCSEAASRSCSLQASERNPALGAAIVLTYFSDPLVVVPCIIGVFAQNILGSILAVWWGLGQDSSV